MWDQRYQTKEYVYGTKPNAFLVEMASQIPAGSKVLCIADGEGRNGVFLAQRGHRVLSIDQSSVGLKKAEELAKSKNVSIETLVADLAKYSIEENQWDAIISIFAHVPPSIRNPLHQQVVQGLKPGGVFILEAYRPEQIKLKTGGPPLPELMMSLSDLKKELQGLQFFLGQEIEREVIEGKFHTGQAAVVQVVALKE